MKILLCGNCQTQGLQVFMRRALPSFDIRCIPHLATFYGEFTEEQIADHHAWADLVFFHHKHDHPQDYPTKQPKIPLSVWFQSAPFMAQIPEDLWEPILKKAQEMGDEEAIRYAVMEHDFDYQSRWDQCVFKMGQKETDELVPWETRLSFPLRPVTKANQCQLTCNHPTSSVFYMWTYFICRYLGVQQSTSAITGEECRANPNIAGLPCEESATSGARKHLGLRWGGRPEDDESGRFIARERLAKLL